MFHRLIGVLAALTLSIGLVAAPTPADAAAHTRSENHHNLVHASNGAGHYASTFWYRGNSRSRPGHDLVWIKPTNISFGYHVTHYIFHPRLACTPRGDLSFYYVRVYVWNPTSGYNHHQGIKVDCDGSSNTVAKGLTHFPRCYMVWDNDTNSRSTCYEKITVERVMWGPDINGHDTVIRKLPLRPFHSTNR